MFFNYAHFSVYITALLCLHNLPLISYTENEYDTSNICAVKYKPGEEIYMYADNLVNYPYASPDYIFQQVYAIKNEVERQTGKRYDMKSTVQYMNSKVKAISGKEIPKKMLNSLLNFIETRDSVFNHYTYNHAFISPSVQDLGVTNVGCFAVSLNYYDGDQLMETIVGNQEIAPWSIPDVPPAVTIGSGLVISGTYMMNSPHPVAKGVGGAFVAVGTNMVAMYAKEKLEDKQGNNNSNGTPDIRQRPIGR